MMNQEIETTAMNVLWRFSDDSMFKIIFHDEQLSPSRSNDWHVDVMQSNHGADWLAFVSSYGTPIIFNM